MIRSCIFDAMVDDFIVFGLSMRISGFLAENMFILEALELQYMIAGLQ